MKISLHSVSYAGISHRGEPLLIEDITVKISNLGWDGIGLMTRRPHADPMDLDERPRRELRESADSHGG